MGTTLHAVLEIHCDKVVDERGEVYAIERWEEFGRWEFEKNYDLMSCLDVVCINGWPKDSDAIRFDEALDYLDNKQWCTGEMLDRLLETHSEDLEHKERLIALCAALRELKNTRVLFGRI